MKEEICTSIFKKGQLDSMQVLLPKNSDIKTQKLRSPTSTHVQMRWLVATKKSFLIKWTLRRVLIA